MDSIYTSEIVSLNLVVCDTTYRSKKIWDTCNIANVSGSGCILDWDSFPQLLMTSHLACWQSKSKTPNLQCRWPNCWIFHDTQGSVSVNLTKALKLQISTEQCVQDRLRSLWVNKEPVIVILIGMRHGAYRSCTAITSPPVSTRLVHLSSSLGAFRMHFSQVLCQLLASKSWSPVVCGTLHQAWQQLCLLDSGRAKPLSGFTQANQNWPFQDEHTQTC